MAAQGGQNSGNGRRRKKGRKSEREEREKKGTKEQEKKGTKEREKKAEKQSPGESIRRDLPVVLQVFKSLNTGHVLCTRKGIWCEQV